MLKKPLFVEFHEILRREPEIQEPFVPVKCNGGITIVKGRSDYLAKWN